MGLTAATYLGDNTVPILADLVDYLRGRTGLDIEVDQAAGRTSREALARAADVDVLWMCGRLTMTMIRDGDLEHRPVAAPVFPGEHDAVYHSLVISHRRHGPRSIIEALAGTLGINEPESWSGHHGLRAHVAATVPDRWFARTTITGSHRGSIAAVAGGRCDVAAIDSTIWRYMNETEPDRLQRLAVIDRTADWPAPPISLSPTLRPFLAEVLRNALLSVDDDRVVGLRALRPTALPAYDRF